MRPTIFAAALTLMFAASITIHAQSTATTTGDQTVMQPVVGGTQTTFGANSFNNFSYARLFKNGPSSRAFINAFAALPHGGSVIADPGYLTMGGGQYDNPGYFGGSWHGVVVPTNSQLLDYRFGAASGFHHNWGSSASLLTYDAEDDLCDQDVIDTTGASFTKSNFASNCFNIVSAAQAPGWYYGPGNWNVQSALNITHNTWSLGIHNGIALAMHSMSPDDLNITSYYANTKGGWLIGASQGVGNILEIAEVASFTAKVASAANSGASGTGSLTLTNANGANLGLKSPLIDETTDAQGLTVTSATANTATFSAASFATSMTCTIKTAPSASPYTTTYTAVPVTFHVSCPSAPAINQLMALGLNTSDNLEPSVRITTAPTVVSPGVYAITASIRYGHIVGETISIGGMVGHYLEGVADTDASKQRYVESVLGSTATTLTLGSQSAYGPNGYQAQIPLGTGSIAKLYCGAEVTGVLNPATNTVDGGYVGVSDNDCTWRPGDVVENTNQISGAYGMHQEVLAVSNPNAGTGSHSAFWQSVNFQGIGSTAPRHNGVAIGLNNTNASSLYNTNGGAFAPPAFLELQGQWGSPFIFDIGITGTCILCNGGYAGAVHQWVDIFRQYAGGAFRWNEVGSGKPGTPPSLSFSMQSQSGGTLAGGLYIDGPLTATGASASSQYSTTVTRVTASTAPALIATNGLQTITLTSNTAPTMRGIAAGQRITFQICQDATGGHTWTWPASIHGGMIVGSKANTCSMQSFDSFNGTTLMPESAGIANIAP